MSGRLTGRRIAPVLLVVAGLLVAPAAASAATTRYAAPGGTAAAADCTTPSDPCSISEAAQGTGVASGDVAVIEPGSYTDSDLGSNGFVQPVASDVHGAPGQPRPVITLSSDPGFGAFLMPAGKTLSHVEVDTAVAATNLHIEGGVVDDFIARSSTGSGPIVCKFTGTGTLKDSACISSGEQGRSVGSFFSAAGTQNVTLRNVTAISTGTNSHAIDFAAAMSGQNLNVDAKSVIANSTGSGVTDVYGQEFNGANVSITLDHSDFSGSGAQGTPTISSPFANNNQITPASLASDSIHQLSTSVTVNAGATDGSSGTTDIDGQNRTIGGTPDIGADELGHPTTTQVVCNPNPTLVGSGTTCTATVIDTASTGAGVPQGMVTFSTDATGSAFDAQSCMLSQVGENGGTCHVTYTPGAVETGTHQISASYPGDSTRDPSNGSVGVGVAKHPSATRISCAPASLTLGSGGSTCVVTVTDTSTAASAPTGSVALSSASGSFGSGCESLASVSTSQASCTVTYTPASAGTSTLTGQYGGDSTHETSEGTALVNVAASSSSVVTAKKCKKKRKKHSASSAKKTKCKKKKRR